ncbi:hypothetical protein [Mesorhizobium sp. M7A.F.Ca.CA.002.12.1.1]|uniref:hypothetical protein n=1 Tax=Mesorhizobium sp. M7A.F.Ca.CA.002.12.1.1 TaxID=2496735 RepID=UPI000FCC3C5A|nr:hypothetical protein [Mesorhizobium sp. M7A.F.Ca.CA.002.12.1.1]RUX60131.1 hypothetical protein EN989_10960 [Mesorhizobium sp. M7A.F.Ca.CA.002.12.1.1]
MAKYIITVEILLEADGEGEACDAIAETMRPLLKEFGGECFIDWGHLEPGSPRLATEEDVARFEYVA